MSETWWRERSTAPLPRRWLFHRNPQPLRIRTPLRVAVRNSLVQPVENQLNASPEAEPVDWLLHLDIASTEHTNVVNVEERPSVFADVQPMPSKNGPHPQQLSADTEVSRPASDEPSLADWLRMLLAVPLEFLLPGPNTAIDWALSLVSSQQKREYHPEKIKGAREVLINTALAESEDRKGLRIETTPFTLTVRGSAAKR